MAWSWRPVLQSFHLFLLVDIISMVICWWVWLHRTAYAVSPPSYILWFISFSYILLAIMVFPATIIATQPLQISKLTVSVIVRAALIFALSVSLATLMAAAAFEAEPPIIVSSTASLAAYAINTFFLGVLMTVLLPLVPVTEIIHTRFLSVPDYINYTAFGIPAILAWNTTGATLEAVRIAAASHALVAATKPITGPFEASTTASSDRVDFEWARSYKVELKALIKISRSNPRNYYLKKETIPEIGE
ncbi:hypothetical protein PIB30_022074 [Stylosanthes scabra]|uniref:Uncharacterized protein n=1 Tax=Stylosanthes scabra TaxID=79078 RepID=A0ABU6Q8S5_9FABA|nr:hypothetical protein [Stylosanthes scabra]